MSDRATGAVATVNDDAVSAFAGLNDDAVSAFAGLNSDAAASFASLNDDAATSFASLNSDAATSFASLSDDPATSFASLSDDPDASFAGQKDAANSFASLNDDAAGAFAGVSDDAATSFAGVNRDAAAASAGKLSAYGRARRGGGMVKPLLAAVAAWVILGIAAMGHAQAPPLDALLKEVDAAKASVTTLSGEFTQRNRVKLFKQELVAHGKLYFRQPRQIRWEYTTPDPSTLILDGNRATLSSPGAAPQVFDLAKDATMRAIFDQLLVWLGSGSLAQARADYELASGGTAAAPTLLLTPKPASTVARAFARVELRLDGKTHLLRAIALVEPNGDEKEIVFTKLAKNVTLPENAFH